MIRCARSFILFIALPALGVFGPGCSDEAKCPPGSTKVGSQCRPAADVDQDSSQGGDAGMDGMPDASPCTAETCNGLDDDCDGEADEELGMAVYVDEDRDGVGAGQSTIACLSDGFSTISGDCNDRESTIAAGLPELCDGIDNDCDGAADQSLACRLGATELACVTSCGSQGKGACSDQCTIPTGAACLPPAEICNRVDDDCDNAADEGLLKRIGPDGVWTYGDPDLADGYNYLSLTPRSGGGAWLLYLPGTHPDATARSAGSLSVAQLSADGKGQQADALAAKMNDTTNFVAAGNDEVTALLRRTSSGQLHLQLFSASTLSFISETVASYTSPNTQLLPRDVAVYSEADHHYVAVVYSIDASPKQETAVAVMELRPTGTWVTNVSASAPFNFGSVSQAQVHVEPVPCRRGFALAYATSAEVAVRHLSLDGAQVPAASIANPTEIFALSHRPSSCEQGAPDPELVLGYTLSDGQWGKSRFRRLRVSASGTYTSAGDEDAKSKIVTGAAAFSGGRWLVTGYEYEQLNSGTALPWLWELDFDALETERVRDLPIMTAASGAATPGQLSALMTVHVVRTAIIDTGSSVVAAFPNSQDEDTASPLSAARPPGATDPAVVGSYRLGCP